MLEQNKLELQDQELDLVNGGAEDHNVMLTAEQKEYYVGSSPDGYDEQRVK